MALSESLGDHVQFLCGLEDDAGRLQSMPQLERDQIDFVFGHYYFGLHRLFTRQTVYISILREPRERILSCYRFVKSSDHPLHDLVKANASDFSSFLRLASRDPRVQDLLDNVQVRMISGHMGLAKDYTHHLGTAISNISTENFIVGDVDRLDRLVVMLDRHLDIKYPRLPLINETGASEAEPMFADLDTEATHYLEHFTKWDGLLRLAARASSKEQPTFDTSYDVPHDGFGLEKALVRALYRALLLREPDEAGFARAINAIHRGESVEDLVTSFLTSHEFSDIQTKFLHTYALPGSEAVSTTVPRISSASDGGPEPIELTVSGLEQKIERLYRAVLRRSPDSSGRAHYMRLLEQGCSEFDVVIRLMNSPEFSKKALVPSTELHLHRVDEYDPEADNNVNRFLTDSVRRYTARIRERTLEQANFEQAVAFGLSETGSSVDNEYLVFHRERFYEIDCALANILSDRSVSSVLDFGLSIHSFMLRKLFPLTNLSVADRPGISIPAKFDSAFTVDLTDDNLSQITLGDQFDIIIFSEVIEHVMVHPVNIIRFLLKQLTDKGAILLTTPNLFSREKLRRVTQRLNPLPPYPKTYRRSDAPHFHIREYCMGEMLSYIDQAGGEIIACHFSGCWDEPDSRDRYPAHELANLFLLFKAKTAEIGSLSMGPLN